MQFTWVKLYMKNIKIVHENDVYDKELKPINRGVEMSAMNKNCPECGHHAWQHEAIGCEFLETTLHNSGNTFEMTRTTTVCERIDEVKRCILESREDDFHKIANLWAEELDTIVPMARLDDKLLSWLAFLL